MSAAKIVTVPCKYKTGKVLGQGTYATVKEAVHIETGKFYAVKVINKKLMQGRESMIKNEINVLRRISQGHPNILSLVDFFETMNNLYLVTELALGGELFDRICKKQFYYEKDAAELVKIVVSAVAYLHDHGIVHRDLKPENLLFRTPDEDADLLIADFGLSRVMDTDKFQMLMTTCGTPGYMAPEIFRKAGHGKQVDMWAIGVITFFLLSGYTPFDSESNQEEVRNILEAKYSYDPQYWSDISKHARNFIDKLLTVDPTARMTAHQALEHPWLASVPLKKTAAAVTPPQDQKQQDLLPHVRQNFNARRTFKRAVDAVRFGVRMGSTLKNMDVEGDIRPVSEGPDQVLKQDDSE
ncbi:hypothetical protein BZG36_03343 [Bifiguratus adelaidae]|uniref:Protein kinase domain-containing protein n=1 Tax=Bifiguratus adelaidae TaxID=1938954 RepID=A0A261XWK0_9FUNG|nr:hypothetical protein BZG36_03343 [Bifiguratus adelaidae]